MITIEYLNKYELDSKNYEYEIKRIIRDINLENKKTAIDSVRGSSNVYPYIQRYYEINGRDEKTINKLEKRKKYFQNKKKKLEKELEYKLKDLTKTDAILADIIRQKYIEKLEWKQIAMNCNYSYESGPRNYFNRFFDKK